MVVLLILWLYSRENKIWRRGGMYDVYQLELYSWHYIFHVWVLNKFARASREWVECSTPTSVTNVRTYNMVLNLHTEFRHADILDEYGDKSAEQRIINQRRLKIEYYVQCGRYSVLGVSIIMMGNASTQIKRTWKLSRCKCVSVSEASMRWSSYRSWSFGR